MNQASKLPLAIAPSKKVAEEWALVLVAEGLSPALRFEGGRFVLEVPEAELERAMAALAAYEREQPDEPLETAAASGRPDLRLAVGAAVAWIGLFAVTGPRNPAVGWFARGSADVDRIRDGELWRAVTALTLHADAGHVLANVLVGGLFLALVGGALGPGLALALVLVAGTGANLLNALLQASPHVSVGGSSAVFGAVGLLVGLGVKRRRRRVETRARAWIPVAAGLALLAMLGASPSSDLWAHFFGLVVGAILGVGVPFVVTRRPGALGQWMLGLASLAALAWAWGLAA